MLWPSPIMIWWLVIESTISPYTFKENTLCQNPAHPYRSRLCSEPPAISNSSEGSHDNGRFWAWICDDLWFNQSESETIPRESNTLPVRRWELEKKVLFGVIDVDTFYRALHGRRDKYKVVPFTLYQCLKYYENAGDKRIYGDFASFFVLETRYTVVDVRALKISRNGLRMKKELRWRTRFWSVKVIHCSSGDDSDDDPLVSLPNEMELSIKMMMRMKSYHLGQWAKCITITRWSCQAPHPAGLAVVVELNTFSVKPTQKGQKERNYYQSPIR